MIRLGDRIKITQSELSAYQRLTGQYKTPQTVNEYDAALETAASELREQDDSPESRLLQAILLAERIQQ